MTLAAVSREAVATAWGTKVASLVSIVMVAGMVIAVLLTTGRTVGAQQGVVDTLDDAGTRAIVVRAQEGSGLDTSSLARLEGVSSIAWLGGFGSAQDSTNTLVPGGTKVPIRFGFGIDLVTLGVTAPGLPGTAYASAVALEQLGMHAAAGSVTTVDGIDYSISGRIEVPEHLAFLEPLIVVPVEAQPAPVLSGGATSAQVVRGEDLAILVAIASDAAHVAGVTDAVRGVIDVTDPQLVTIETSQQLAQLRQLIDAQLGGAGRALVLIIFGLTAVLVAAILYGLVMMRRKDFGRRRALGASQGLIVGLVLAQVAALGCVGALLGGAVSFTAMAVGGDPQPPPNYYAAIMILAAVTAAVAAVVPAAVAARRDPVRELRVP
ncbi:FtsX-like permease family protein [Agrococcus sp. Marseille-Q4369]|uniref:FtsX-like permease family protein n=1 Tax=Agrococcus sp. Marseille-Q4369 TaxID=2810513 RepID=UPI001B8AE2F4|nr:FtsX-like permease family protein [Agrococcus sp. Marseille-Q4369]QUW18647.1 lipoprotein ABC transporter permease [Agrococcus sp. Marseille-Q4369]